MLKVNPMHNIKDAVKVATKLVKEVKSDIAAGVPETKGFKFGLTKVTEAFTKMHNKISELAKALETILKEDDDLENIFELCKREMLQQQNINTKQSAEILKLQMEVTALNEKLEGKKVE